MKKKHIAKDDLPKNTSSHSDSPMIDEHKLLNHFVRVNKSKIKSCSTQTYEHSPFLSPEARPT